MFRALQGRMGVRNYRELIAWQLGDELETEIIRIVTGSNTCKDLKFQSQLFDASAGVPSNIAEGFLRMSPGEFCRFLDFALSGLGEVETRVGHGIKRKFWHETEAAPALRLCRRCSAATRNLKRSQERFRRPRRPPSRWTPT
jgi:four helix bundle protein